MTNLPLSPEALADEFGVADPSDIADDLYADYLDFVADEICTVEETEA